MPFEGTNKNFLKFFVPNKTIKDIIECHYGKLIPFNSKIEGESMTSKVFFNIFDILKEFYY